MKDNSPWYKTAIFYEVNVRAFCDSNADGNGDLPGLAQKLDYIQSLGVDCIWLQPLYPSPLVDDGYDIADYYNIAPDYGSVEDFKRLLDEAHARGLKVITDLVLNHTSDQHPWFQAARSSPDSPYRNYYVWSDTDQKYSLARIIFLDTEKSNWTWDEQAGQFFWHRFYSSQPDLNYDSPEVREEMKKIMRFWLDMGIDGFRADAVPYLFEREGTNCENLPETHAYVKEIAHMMDEKYPGRLLLAEANQWPQDVRAYFGDEDEFHMAFHFPVMPRLYMALARGSRTPIVDILAATPPIPASCQWCTFLRNHDELTLEMVTTDERDFMWDTYAPEPRMRLNLGIRRRLAPLLDGDRRKIELLNSILFTLPGTPILYYGDEIGMGDDIWMDDRDGVRTPMQWNAGLNAGFSNAAANKLYSPVLHDPKFGYQVVNVESQQKDPGSLLNSLRRMIAVRKSQPALLGDHYEILALENKALLALVRSNHGQTVLAVHNLSGQEQETDIDFQPYRCDKCLDLLEGKVVGEVMGRTRHWKMKPYGYQWLKLEE